MSIKNIISKVDHTLLSQVATFSEIRNLCDEGIKYGVASVCIPPCHVKEAKKYVENKLSIGTVIGFPNGYSSRSVKLFETDNAISNGADEIDMVINLSYLKDKRYNEIESEIRSIKQICDNRILKVIIETCFLTDEEKIVMCKIISSTGADFIKTSTGFAKSGAKLEDINLFRENLSADVKIKAAGGISDLQDAQKFIDAGVSRIGTSKIINIIKGLQV